MTTILDAVSTEEDQAGERAFNAAMKKAHEAHNDLLKRLFGEVPKDVGSMVVSREKYAGTMREVQKDHGLIEGNPDLVLFVLEQLSRSPKFEKEEMKADEPASMG